MAVFGLPWPSTPSPPPPPSSLPPSLPPSHLPLAEGWCSLLALCWCSLQKQTLQKQTLQKQTLQKLPAFLRPPPPPRAACGRRLVVVVTETCGPRDTRPAFGGRGWCRSFPGLVAPCAAALATGVPFCSSFRRCCCWGVAPPHDLKPCSMRRMQGLGAVARINTDGPHAELSTSPDGIACMHARGAVHVWQPARLRTLCAHVGFRARCAEAR